MKKRRSSCFIAAFLAIALAFVITTPAGAALYEKTIKVLTGVDIFVDGILMEPTDANGNLVETFVYNGTTYVPLRAVSQSLGKAVDWDGVNQRVYIGEKPGEKQYLLDVCPPYETNEYRTPATVTLVGQKYSNAFTFEANGFALYNLNGSYNTFSFDVGHVDGQKMWNATILVYLDGELALSIDLKCDNLPQHVDLPLYGALQMKIEMECTALSCQYAIVNATIE